MHMCVRASEKMKAEKRGCYAAGSHPECGTSVIRGENADELHEVLLWPYGEREKKRERGMLGCSLAVTPEQRCNRST